MNSAGAQLGLPRVMRPAVRPPEALRGLDAVAHGVMGRVGSLRLTAKRFLREAASVLALEPSLSAMTDAELGEAAEAVRAVFRRGREIHGDVVRGAAVIREAAYRELGLRAFGVQVAGALAVHAGCIAEMATGEGKTLSAVLAAAMAGWRGRGVHVVTANDYLARRDAELMGPVYRRLGLRAAFVEGLMGTAARRAAYAADITYCTNKEVAADFLRDKLDAGRRPALLRGLYHAIVDEADFVLIDEAVTPLIISGEEPNGDFSAACVQAREIAAALHEGTDYRLRAFDREAELTVAGEAKAAELAAGLGGLWAGPRRREELVRMAVEARAFFLRGREYIIQDGKVVIVDESTGRLMPDRSWRDGVQQAVEAKEGLEVTALKGTQARISFQRFFRLYKHLAGMTGTASEAAGELWHTYRLPVVRIPANRPCIRQVAPMRIAAGEAAKWNAVADEAAAVSSAGRPVLIGTRTVADSEAISAELSPRGLEHSVLNAVNHRQEAEIIARAGEAGRITVSTNMAGRGTDIRLSDASREAGGLHVIATARHDSSRIDRQLFGRAGRQGDPGSGIMIVSLSDDLMSRYGGPVGRRLGRAGFALAQMRAERAARARRREVLVQDDWIDEFLAFAGEA